MLDIEADGSNTLLPLRTFTDEELFKFVRVSVLPLINFFLAARVADTGHFSLFKSSDKTADVD